MTKNEPLSITVDQIIEVDIGRSIRIYRVLGIYYGAVGQESMVGVEVLDKHNGVTGAIEIFEMLIPVDIVQILLQLELELKKNKQEEREAKSTPQEASAIFLEQLYKIA